MLASALFARLKALGENASELAKHRREPARREFEQAGAKDEGDRVGGPLALFLKAIDRRGKPTSAKPCVEAGKVSRSAGGPVSATSATPRGRRFPPRARPQAAQAPPARPAPARAAGAAAAARPGHRCIRTADRPSERENGDVDQRPDEQGSKCRRGENREEKERRAERQLALTHETSEAPRPEYIRPTDGARPQESDARRKHESEKEARHREPSETRNPRASLTGCVAEVSVVRVGSAPLASMDQSRQRRSARQRSPRARTRWSRSFRGRMGLALVAGRHRVSYTWRTASEGGGPGGTVDRGLPIDRSHRQTATRPHSARPSP